MTIFSIFILAAGVVWIFASRSDRRQPTADGNPAPQTGFFAPDFSLTTSSGQRLQLSELRGQAVVVNLWASWCTPCQAEMPALERVYQEYRSQGLIILAVNATNQDDPGQAAAFALGKGLSFPILLDPDGKVSQAYELHALPSSFFIDRKGIIREVVVGGPMAEALLRVRIQEILTR